MRAAQQQQLGAPLEKSLQMIKIHLEAAVPNDQRIRGYSPFIAGNNIIKRIINRGLKNNRRAGFAK
ncbi:hypothetical protein D3C78_1854800 [compost metagenome]